MKINLEDYPPNCGKSLTIPMSSKTKLVGLVAAIIINGITLLFLVGMINSITATQDYTGIYIMLILELFFALGFAASIFNYFKPDIGALTLSQAGLGRTTIFGNWFYKWRDIKDINYGFVSTPGKVYSVMTFTTTSKRKIEVIIEHFDNPGQELAEYIEKWRQFYSE